MGFHLQIVLPKLLLQKENSPVSYILERNTSIGLECRNPVRKSL